MLVPLPHVKSLCSPGTLVWAQEDLSFRFLASGTKMYGGSTEILSDVPLIKTGDKVGASEATLVIMQNISPSSFELIIQSVFDNCSICNPEVLDVAEETLHPCFLEGVCNAPSLCLQTGYPSVASVPYSIISGNKWVLPLFVKTDYTFLLAGKVKSISAAPSAFVAAASVDTAATTGATAPDKVEVKEESEEDMEFGLFD
ncbi:hypothetical protein H8958_010405 [Nasalis larvatus]